MKTITRTFAAATLALAVSAGTAALTTTAAIVGVSALTATTAEAGSSGYPVRPPKRRKGGTAGIPQGNTR